MTTTLQSYIGGRWLGAQQGTALRSAINGKAVFSTHEDRIDFAEAVQHARKTGVPAKLPFLPSGMAGPSCTTLPEGSSLPPTAA